ncbi:MAG: sugar ABC transporter permease [Chloroflexi bacterium]|nr:sugar ABC transporter permease [Chloroflexota bacterium]
MTQQHQVTRTVEVMAPPSAGLRLQRLLGRDWALAWVLMLPVVAALIGLIAYPFLLAIYLSFTDKMIGSQPNWVGLDNYVAILTGSEFGAVFWKSVVNTAIMTVAAVAGKVVIGMVMALFLNEEMPARNFVRALCFLPWAIPSLIIGLTWKWMYNGTTAGMLNMILIQLGLSDSLIQWLADPAIALWSVILVLIWSGAPFYGMMFLAGLQSIPKDLYEAASIDGANVVQRYINITLPGLSSVIAITVLLSTIWTANSINFIFILTGGGPGHATITFPMLAYEVGIAAAQRLGTASALTILFMPFFLVIIYILTKRMLAEET